MYLMMKHAFELGYRRYEWKCDNNNAGSKQAAKRLGFSFDGLFKQATIYKNRNRDTAWFSVLDQNWPDVQARFEAWLSPENFNGHGHQIKKLNE
jgi:RimJ/RimL family protein N-acetyltransferase